MRQTQGCIPKIVAQEYSQVPLRGAVSSDLNVIQIRVMAGLLALTLISCTALCALSVTSSRLSSPLLSACSSGKHLRLQTCSGICTSTTGRAAAERSHAETTDMSSPQPLSSICGSESATVLRSLGECIEI